MDLPQENARLIILIGNKSLKETSDMERDMVSPRPKIPMGQ